MIVQQIARLRITCIGVCRLCHTGVTLRTGKCYVSFGIRSVSIQRRHRSMWW